MVPLVLILSRYPTIAVKMIKLNILAFGAHPDDIELGCGGTISRLVKNGHKADFVYMTSGEAGSDKIEAKELQEIREAEAKEGAKILGASSVEFLRLCDIHAERKREDLISIIKLIRQKKPDVIFTHSKEDQSEDHIFYTKLICDAVFSASGPWFEEVKLAPHNVRLLYGYEVWSPISSPQLLISIDESEKEKRAAVSAHQSQMKGFGYLEGIMGLNRFRGELSAQSHFAEAFEVIKDCSELALF